MKFHFPATLSSESAGAAGASLVAAVVDAAIVSVVAALSSFFAHAARSGSESIRQTLAVFELCFMEPP